MRDSKGRFIKGSISWNTNLKGQYKLWPNGRTFSKEHKNKMSLAKKGKLRGQNKIDKICLYCKNIYQSRASSKRKFCSVVCASYYHSENYTKEKHHFWKGGYEHKLLKNRQRRIKKLSLEGGHTLQQWQDLKKQYNYICPSCNRKEDKINCILTQDHIVPVSKGGNDYIENIQPLCKQCNSSKCDKIIKF